MQPIADCDRLFLIDGGGKARFDDVVKRKQPVGPLGPTG
jgi:hypothetical protein